MKKGIISFIGFLLLLSAVQSCKKDEVGTLTLNISNLEDLGSGWAYEGWLIVDGSPVSTGTFTVGNSGELSASSFSLDVKDLEAATKFVLTIEPSPDADPSPSKVHILAGDFSGSDANLSIGDPAALGNDFSGAGGKYILATPTNGMNTDEKSGIWFLNIGAAGPEVGLNLPSLPDGWKYEGWTVINGTPVSTGTFTAVDKVDDGAPYSAGMPGPPFPGEDFLRNAPSGLSFPTDISGGKAVISIEPSPDNSPMPFQLKPLVGDIPANAMDHTPYGMGQNLNFPSGSATR